MTEQEAVEVLASFMGFYLIQPPEEDGTCGFSLRGLDNIFYPWRDTREEAWVDGPSFLESLDALRPVLARLNEYQWGTLHYQLSGTFSGSISRTRWLLTLPPRDLAMAVAEVIKDSNKMNYSLYLKQAILNTARMRKNSKRILWVIVADLCGCGSTTAAQICRALDLNSDATIL